MPPLYSSGAVGISAGTPAGYHFDSVAASIDEIHKTIDRIETRLSGFLLELGPSQVVSGTSTPQVTPIESRVLSIAEHLANLEARIK